MARAHTTTGQMIAEMREFAGLTAEEQHYIARSLDLGLERCDMSALGSEDGDHGWCLRSQATAYGELGPLRSALTDAFSIEALDEYFGVLVRISAQDLARGFLGSFAAYRFLYERLLGPALRPLLPASFCAAATLPHLEPDLRRLLLESVNEDVATATRWPQCAPSFVPSYIAPVPE